jgi:hypothetical protein
MKSFSKSRLSLDIPPINVTLILPQLFMSRVKKTALVLAVLFSLEFLSLGLFTKGTFSWTDQYVPPLLKATSHAHPRAAKLDSPAKPDSRFVLESSGEPIPPSGVFLTAKENVGGISHRRFVVSPFFLKSILAPKVSRYISKSVLIL